MISNAIWKDTVSHSQNISTQAIHRLQGFAVMKDSKNSNGYFENMDKAMGLVFQKFPSISQKNVTERKYDNEKNSLVALLNSLKITVVRRARRVPHCFFLFWGSVRSPLIFNVLHQHRPHMVPDSHANKSPASTAKHINPDLHANRSPASAAKHTYHLHCTQLNYKTHKHHRTVCKCRLCFSLL